MTDIVVPKWGLTMEEAQIVAWLKQVGDFAGRDEPIAELETDKAADELLSPTDGVITEILVEAGQMVEPGQVIGRMEEATQP